MKKLAEVQEAKELMKEAMGWSTLKWLWEKQRVRQTADAANAALDRQERSVKAKWNDNCKAVYKRMSAKRPHESGGSEAESGNSQIELLIENVLKADQAAKHAKQVAEDTFDEAERRMSTDLAREGCKKAIHSWALHEKAIHTAEAVTEPRSTGKPTKPAA